MSPSKVYFSDLRASVRENFLAKLVRLMNIAGLQDTVTDRDIVGIKLHFGEKGNTAFIRPLFIRQIVNRVKELGGSPFLTDSNTLYSGTRGDSISHLNTAIENGFAYSVVNAPVIIADGLRGSSFSEVKINEEILKKAYIGKEITESDALISVAHFKGHEVSGFGGTIKNVGMGCASRRGKLDQHSGLSPQIKKKKCIACGDCVVHCSQNAISLVDEKAVIDPEKCIGCAECILICPNGAIDIQWSTDVSTFQKKMAEYTAAVLRGKKGKALFINFLTNVSPACDCYGHSDAPIVHDLGVMASKDPIAIDQASIDMVNRQMPAEGTCLKSSIKAGDDKFRSIYPKIDWSVQLDHAEKIGLGTRQYELESI
ncbi:MAG: DUF362 domain-containing protein [Desulfatiglans sp.]|jgi:uncharacterized Fe-S center protein|nr:DUF362 domain-containing protein [Thermodesulfobacteriota bacterium]MEE4352618.1 DUF362 domain-containing protein [Desulfatiglans sp.]